MDLHDQDSNCSVAPICDSHIMIESKTLGKWLTRCEVCGKRKKWPLARTMQCCLCEKSWHRKCVSPAEPAKPRRRTARDVIAQAFRRCGVIRSSNTESHGRSSRVGRLGAEVAASPSSLRVADELRDNGVGDNPTKTIVESGRDDCDDITPLPSTDALRILSPSHATTPFNRTQSKRLTAAINNNEPVAVRNRHIRQTFIEIKEQPKMHHLLSLLNKTDDCHGTVVFVNDMKCAERVVAQLNLYNYSATNINSRKYSEHEQIVTNLKNRNLHILVGTEHGTGLLDRMDTCRLVINYDVPKTIDEYSLRIRRISRLKIKSDTNILSFYLPRNDIDIAAELVCTLKQNDQQIPEFLLETGRKRTNNKRTPSTIYYYS